MTPGWIRMLIAFAVCAAGAIVLFTYGRKLLRGAR